ncbi:MAG: type III secretion system chaperone [Rhodospirillales bacterium]|nr:type III secretion system chaperone [Rhodospirillales bacterium]
MSLARVLSEFASRNGIEGIPPRPDGSFLLVFDDRYKVRFRGDGSNAAIIHARIGVLPTDGRERAEAVQTLLGTATARMRKAPDIVALSEDEREVTLFRRFATDVSPSAFETLLSEFVNALAFWQRAYSSGATRPAVPPIMAGRVL